jgi:hypothetical protein
VTRASPEAVTASESVEDRVVGELGGSLIREVQPGETVPIYDGLTEKEKGAELRAWCKRNKFSYPEGLERLREAEIDRLAKADGWKSNNKEEERE